jgi:hypothetical protein
MKDITGAKNKMTKFNDLVLEVKANTKPLEKIAAEICSTLKGSIEASQSSGMHPTISDLDKNFKLIFNASLVDIKAGPINYSDSSCSIWRLSQKAINLYQGLKAEGYYRSN